MMKVFESTNLSSLREDCKQEFADFTGTRIYGRTEEPHHELVAWADDKGSPAVVEYLHDKLFPAMVYYGALLAKGIPQSGAPAAARREIQKVALIKKESSAQMTCVPFVFLPYCMGVEPHMSKNPPTEGWETEQVSSDGREIHSNLHRCLYWDSH